VAPLETWEMKSLYQIGRHALMDIKVSSIRSGHPSMPRRALTPGDVDAILTHLTTIAEP